MKCQLVATLEAGRRSRRVYAYPVIWVRAVGRRFRWYRYRSLQVLREHTIRPTPDRKHDGSVRAPSVLSPGDWVRVKSRAEIESMESPIEEGGPLVFIVSPMSRYCGRTLRVARVLKHYYDEIRMGLETVDNAVLLEGAVCDSSQLGGAKRCDRGCFHFWKESWLERVPSPVTNGAVLSEEPVTASEAESEAAAGTWRVGDEVRVKTLASIEDTLDTRGERDGVPFIREHMAPYCGRIFAVRQPLTRFYDEKADYTIRLPYACTLYGVHCDGGQGPAESDCDRGCALIWHSAWLEPPIGG